MSIRDTVKTWSWDIRLDIRHKTLRYDTIRYITFTCTRKLTNSRLNLSHWTKKHKEEKLKTKNRHAQKKRSSHKVRGVSPESERESMVGKVCERGRFWAGSERQGVMDGESGELTKWENVVGARTGKSKTDRLEWGWRTELGSWFQRHGEAHRKERSVMRNDKDVGGRARVTRGEEGVLRGGWTEVSLCRCGGWVVVRSADFVSEWEESVFDVFVYVEPVKRA